MIIREKVQAMGLNEDNLTVLSFTKRGRPISKDPKNKGYRIRLTKSEFEDLTSLAKEKGMTKSDFIRFAIGEQKNKTE